MELLLKNISLKKELGQFFSGRAVASLLAHLANFSLAKNIIDPMCGTGDMLSVCIHEGKNMGNLTGIEIDEEVYESAILNLSQFSNVKLINNNAFSLEIASQIYTLGYDLVITNPPYVRYQSINTIKHNFPSVLTIKEIRNNLVKSLNHFQTIDSVDKELLELLIKNYSGLSDLAVPSWILCSLLVKEGGKIAMVVPETWLSRDYALIIKYILLRWFKIEYIIEDANSSWFLPAQVKTTLIVAERIKRNESLLDWNEEKFTYASINSKSLSKKSLVGNIFPHSLNPEIDFKNAIDNYKSEQGFYSSRKISINSFATDLKNMASTQKWFKLIEPHNSGNKLINNGAKTSSYLKNWYYNSQVSFCNLQDMGVAISQGLRTGANNFFYLDCIVEVNNEITVIPYDKLNLPPFNLDGKYFRRVVRKQSELDNSFSLNHFKTKGIVLALQSYALPEDISFVVKCNVAFQNKYHEIPKSLANYIRKAALLKNGNEPSDKLIPDLTAVKPNIKNWNEKKASAIPRFWYMLPEFTKRHFPDLFVPRVNSESVKTRINEDSTYLIDANFSSLWITDKNSAHNNYSLLALLNSSWATVAMEEYGTVMGGGALKLEATQLKKIPFPILDSVSIQRLTEFGHKLSLAKSNTDYLIHEIDCVVLETFGFGSDFSKKIDDLLEIKQRLIKERINK